MTTASKPGHAVAALLSAKTVEIRFLDGDAILARGSGPPGWARALAEELVRAADAIDPPAEVRE